MENSAEASRGSRIGRAGLRQIALHRVVTAALSIVIVLAVAIVVTNDNASADGTCETHYPYRVYDGHGHDGDGDGVGCEWNPGGPSSSGSSSSSSSSFRSSGYDRDNWSYDSSAARSRLGCSGSEHVDHVVALKEAYDSGASSWSNARKRQFANDPLNQWCLDAGLNVSKSDGDLAEWSGGSCIQRQHIAEVTVAVKAKYGLATDSAERRANQAAIAESCGAAPTSQPTQPAPSTSTTTTAGPTTDSTDNAASSASVGSGSPSSISLRPVSSSEQGGAASDGPSIVIDGPSEQAAEPWTASYLFRLVSSHEVVALWQWSGEEWLMYAAVEGQAVPGSTDFQVTAHDAIQVTIE